MAAAAQRRGWIPAGGRPARSGGLCSIAARPATSEATWNAEYPDSIVHKYRSAVRQVIEQLDKSTGDASYCFELDGVESEDTAVWNVTEAYVEAEVRGKFQPGGVSASAPRGA